MKNYKNTALGAVLIILGLIFGINALGVADINLFFDGWWTFLIIIPCLIGLFKKKDIAGNLIGIGGGVILLLICQGIIETELVLKIFFPALLVLFGGKLILKDLFSSKVKKRMRDLESEGEREEYFATFSSKNIIFPAETFEGADLIVAFGSVNGDFAFAEIMADCIINASVTFGSAKIILPGNVNIVLKSSSIFGSAKITHKRPLVAGAPTVYVNANCLFGEVEAK